MTDHSVEDHWLGNLPAIFDAGPGKFKPAPAKDDDLASLLYTSGTTADPKGVMLTHANFLGEVEAVFNWVDLGPTDALLGVLPLFHVLAQMANLLLPLVKGSRVVYLETLNTTELMRALSERNITAFAVVPQFFYLIHERVFQEIKKRGAVTQKVFSLLVAINRTLRKLGINAGRIFFRKIHDTLGPKMRYLATGGSRFDPEIMRDFHDLGIDVLQALGLTETTAAIFVNSPHDNEIGSCGKAMKGVEGKIVDPQPQEDGGPPVGEVAVRGAVVMKGYWNRPDATAAVLRDGWFLTGDLGYFDSKGHLFLTGRKKEVIVLSNGKNVYPEEIEAHYLKSPHHQGNRRDGTRRQARRRWRPAARRDRPELRRPPATQDRQCQGGHPFRIEGLSPRNRHRPSALAATKSGRTICPAPPPARSNASKSRSG